METLTLEISKPEMISGKRRLVIRVLGEDGGDIDLVSNGRETLLSILQNGCSLFASLHIPTDYTDEWKDLLKIPVAESKLKVSVEIGIEYSEGRARAITPLRFPGMDQD